MEWKIPISVLHLKGAKLDVERALYLYGYGSYGVSIDMFFNSNNFPAWSIGEW